MTDPATHPEREWERGWDGHEHAQRRRLARLPFADKLRWLEEAHRLVQALERSRRTGAQKPEPDER